MQNRSGENKATGRAKTAPKVTPAILAASLLAWYDRNGREMPWRVRGRVRGNRRTDPYRVWLSEIMLQQTTVAAVTPYFQKFIARWPTMAALAAAPLDDVLQAWAGLGYYARTRNLHKCARVVEADFAGKFPEDAATLKSLPGIGEYTAAAISAIAFGHPANVVDGNVERVVARLRMVDVPLPAAKRALRDLAGEIAPQRRPGDYAQALMDLGATLCTPRNPSCDICPWASHCQASIAGRAADYPRRAAKKPKPVRHGVVYWIEQDKKIFLERRPDHGLLGGMLCFPGSEWVEATNGPDRTGGGALLSGEVRHTFTHFHLVLRVQVGDAEGAESSKRDGRWVEIDKLSEAGLPSVMQKVARHVVGARRAAE